MELIEKRITSPSQDLYIIEKEQDKKTVIRKEINNDVFSYINRYAYLQSTNTFFIPTSKFSNIRNALKRKYDTIVNINRVNGMGNINEYMESVNDRLSMGGLFIGCAETAQLRSKRLLNKFTFPLNNIYCFFDYIFTRIFPILPFTKQIYFVITGGRNRVLSKVELFGRLYRSGFEIESEQKIGALQYFIARKTKEPIVCKTSSCSPVICLKRVGLNGKILNIYKLRTMYSYSEYLQEYIYKTNSIEKKGKFNNDYRITPLGKFLRKFWIDELPMLVNLIKGDMKLFGVRPLSRQYFSLYTKELQDERIKHRPGLIPPYYVDLPENFDEIMDSEMKYLRYYDKKPLMTNLLYLIIAFNNIVIKGTRSK